VRTNHLSTVIRSI